MVRSRRGVPDRSADRDYRAALTGATYRPRTRGRRRWGSRCIGRAVDRSIALVSPAAMHRPLATPTGCVAIGRGVQRGRASRYIDGRSLGQVLPVVLELEQTALAAEPVGRALVLLGQQRGRGIDLHPAHGILRDGHRVPPFGVGYSPGVYPSPLPSGDGRPRPRSPTARALEAERARLLALLAEGIQAPGPDDLRLAGGRRQPGLRAAARPRAARPLAATQLEDVEAALARLDAGTYGTCVDCGKPGRRRSGWRRCRGRPAASTARPRARPASADERRTERLVDLAAIRAAAADPRRGGDPHAARRRSGRPDERPLAKAESLQPIGAFKIRGAYDAIAGLDETARARGVITYSSGNHAQGVARAARLLGCPGRRRHAVRRAGHQACSGSRRTARRS